MDWFLVRKNDSRIPGTLKRVRRKIVSKSIHENAEKPYSVDDELSLHKDAIKLLIELTVGKNDPRFSEFLSYTSDTENVKKSIDYDINNSGDIL